MKTNKKILKAIHINVPFTMLIRTHLDPLISHEINPEIGLDAEALDGFSPADFNMVANRLRKHHRDITFHAPFIDMSPGSNDPAIRAVTRHRFEQVLRLLPLFRPKSVVCHAGYECKRYDFFKEEWLEKSLETWRWFARSVQGEGSRLMLENVYEDGPEDIQILFEELKKWKVGFCLDTGHQAAFSRTSMNGWLDILLPYIGQLHLHDNRGQDDEHLPMGMGIIDFKSLLNRLHAECASPPIITLEPHREQDLWPSINRLETYWPW